MGAMNRVFLMGNLTRDPELRKTQSGVAVSDLGVAVSEKYRNKDGAAVETVCFVDVVVWDKQAEACKQYLSKGAPVVIEGRLQLDQWQTEAGEKRSRLRVRADRVQFLARARTAANGGGETQGEGEPVGAAAGGEAANGNGEMPF